MWVVGVGGYLVPVLTCVVVGGVSPGAMLPFSGLLRCRIEFLKRVFDLTVTAPRMTLFLICVAVDRWIPSLCIWFMMWLPMTTLLVMTLLWTAVALLMASRRVWTLFLIAFLTRMLFRAATPFPMARLDDSIEGFEWACVGRRVGRLQRRLTVGWPRLALGSGSCGLGLAIWAPENTSRGSDEVYGTDGMISDLYPAT